MNISRYYDFQPLFFHRNTKMSLEEDRFSVGMYGKSTGRGNFCRLTAKRPNSTKTCVEACEGKRKDRQ